MNSYSKKINDCLITVDFIPENRRIYSVEVVAYGKHFKYNVVKLFPLMVYVKEHEELFVNRIRLRCANSKPKIKDVNQIKINYLRKAGYIL